MINETVKIGSNVSIGEHVVIEEDVIIGDDVTIGHHVVIKKDTYIGDRVTIQDSTLLGRKPSGNKQMARVPKMDLSPLIIFNDVNIGSHCVIYQGTTIMEGVLVGDLASIREQVKVGKDSIVGRSAIVEHHTRIGEKVTIQTSSYVTAHMVIEDDVFIGPCFSSSNDKHMGKGDKPLKGPVLKKGAKIGNNASLLPGIIIGEQAIVGAGAVVTKDVESGVTVVGNPAKVI